MYVVTVELAVRREHTAAFVRAMIANATASREREPGCRQFDVCSPPGEPGVVFLYERYDDRAAFDAHVATDHFKEFEAASAGWVERKSVRAFERIDPPG